MTEDEKKLWKEIPPDIFILGVHDAMGHGSSGGRRDGECLALFLAPVRARVHSLAGTHDHGHDSPTGLVRGGTNRTCISYGNILKASASCANCQTSTHTSSPKCTRDDAC